MQTVTVTVGKKYRLAYGTKALRVFEREADKPINELGERFGVDTIATLLHAGMVYNHPEVTADDVDEMLDKYLESGGDIQPVMTTISEAIAACGWFASPTKATASTKDSGKTPAE
jgi:hypothetical protein